MGDIFLLAVFGFICYLIYDLIRLCIWIIAMLLYPFVWVLGKIFGMTVSPPRFGHWGRGR